jgi:hypothetical protein
LNSQGADRIYTYGGNGGGILLVLQVHGFHIDGTSTSDERLGWVRLVLDAKSASL